MTDLGKCLVENRMTNEIAADFEQIKLVLKHRYPFLLLDRVVELEKERRIVAQKNVSGNEPYFVGHFPQEAVMPGVLMVESIAQSLAFLIGLSMGPDAPLLYLLSVDSMRFTSPVRPGDRLTITATVINREDKTISANGSIEVDGKAVVRGRITIGFK